LGLDRASWGAALGTETEEHQREAREQVRNLCWTHSKSEIVPGPESEGGRKGGLSGKHQAGESGHILPHPKLERGEVWGLSQLAHGYQRKGLCDEGMTKPGLKFQLYC
jgi:hypothetical protein